MSKATFFSIIFSVLILFVGIFHLLFPQITTDGFTIVLFILLLLPWLRPFIKTLELPGIGKIEFQEVKRATEEAKGAAESANKKAEFAVAQNNVSNAKTGQENNVPAHIEFQNLADEYDMIRASKPNSPVRTSEMAAVFSKMILIASKVKNFDVITNLKAKDAGLRLTACAYIITNPEIKLLQPLVDSLTTIEDKGFNQYWDTQAIEKILEKMPVEKIPRSIFTSLEKFKKKRLQPGTDRYYELTRLLNSYNFNP